MTKGILAGIVVIVLMFPASAGAFAVGSAVTIEHGPAWTRSQVVAPDATWPYQRWVNKSLVPTVAGTVTVSPDTTACEGAEGCLLPGRDIRLDPNEPPYIERTMFLHEEGHEFDAERMTDPARAEFMSLFGLTGEWESSRIVEGWENGPPVELFAQAYALCALVAHRDEVREWESVYGYWPTEAQHQAVCRLIRSVTAAG